MRGPPDLGTLRAGREAWLRQQRRSERWHSLKQMARSVKRRIRLTGQVALNTYRYGRVTKERFGHSLSRQIADQFTLASTNFLTPYDYYSGGIATCHGSDEMYTFVPWHFYVVNAQLCERYYRETYKYVDRITEKEYLERKCREAGFPCVKTRAIVDAKGARSFDGDDIQLPLCDLFVKPAYGLQGRGAQRWDFVSDRFEQLGSDVSLSAAELLDFLQQYSSELGHRLLVQEVALNHPSIEVITGKMLAVVRIVTMYDLNRKPIVVASSFGASGNRTTPVCNLYAGGTYLPIEQNTGCLGKGIQLDFPSDPVEYVINPVTEMRIEGETLPYWSETCELAIQLHRELGQRFTYGWDIAITPTGPIVVETNHPPGLAMAPQYLSGGFLRSPFSQLLVKHVEYVLRATELDGPGARDSLNATLNRHAGRMG